MSQWPQNKECWWHFTARSSGKLHNLEAQGQLDSLIIKTSAQRLQCDFLIWQSSIQHCWKYYEQCFWNHSTNHTFLYISGYISSENKVIFIMRLISMLLWQKKFSLVVKNIDCSHINGKMITLEFEGQVEFEHGHKTMALRRGEWASK